MLVFNRSELLGITLRTPNFQNFPGGLTAPPQPPAGISSLRSQLLSVMSDVNIFYIRHNVPLLLFLFLYTDLSKSLVLISVLCTPISIYVLEYYPQFNLCQIVCCKILAFSTNFTIIFYFRILYYGSEMVNTYLKKMFQRCSEVKYFIFFWEKINDLH